MTVFPHNFPRVSGSALKLVQRPTVSATYSGLTTASDREHLAVHDTKDPNESKLSSFDWETGQTQPVTVDWSRTEQPEDLEAVAYVDGQPGQFMAVEGSRYNGRTPHLFLFDYADGNGTALKRFDLPQLPYEIEGMVTRQREDGDVLVVLGGRGDEKTREGRLHWGLYDPQQQEMEWSEQGCTGVPVSLPTRLGDEERPISELHLDRHDQLWGAGCMDNGNEGPFESLIYRVGHLNANAANPVTVTVDQPVRVRGQKVEAMDARAEDGRFLLGTDDESYGGTLQFLLGTTEQPASVV